MASNRAEQIDQLLSIGLALLCVATAFLPWQRSGQVSRSGYSLLGSAQQAGLVTGESTKALAVAAYLMPTVAALVLAAWLLRRRRLACALSGLVGVVTVVGAVVVLEVSRTGVLFGTQVALATGIVAVTAMVGRAVTWRAR